MDKHTLKLQTNLSRLGFQPGRLDGLFGNKTLAALNHWQKQYELPTSDEVRPEDHTAVEEALAERRQNVIPLGTYQFSEVFPRAKAEYRSHLNQALTEGCMTGDRALMFLAQLGHESAGLRYMEEIASGAAYEGRLDLGNTQVNDGTRFKGRGPLQLTGRANYRRFGDLLNIPFASIPTIAARPNVGFRVAVMYWTDRGLNAWADAGDFRRITREINGGYNGMDDRNRWLHRIRTIL